MNNRITNPIVQLDLNNKNNWVSKFTITNIMILDIKMYYGSLT
jgi:hypothetical protein